MEEINADRVRAMLTSKAPAVRQQGMKMLADLVASRKRIAGLGNLIKLLVDPTVQVDGSGQPKTIVRSQEDREVRMRMQNAIGGLSAGERKKVQQAIQQGRMQLDADQRKKPKDS